MIIVAATMKSSNRNLKDPFIITLSYKDGKYYVETSGTFGFTCHKRINTGFKQFGKIIGNYLGNGNSLLKMDNIVGYKEGI